MKGIEYFGVQTDIGESDELYDLMDTYRGELGDEAAWAAAGRLVILLSAIYRQGFALRVTKGNTRRLAVETGLEPEDLRAFIERCVDAGWFDREIWDTDSVLTSRGIQRRWLAAFSGRGKRRPTLTEEEAKHWLLDEDLTVPEAPVMRKGAKRSERERNGAKGSETERKRAKRSERVNKEEEEEEDKEKEKEEEEEKRNGARSVASAQSSSSSSHSPSPNHRTDATALSCLDRDGSGTYYGDLRGEPHETPLEALQFGFAQATGEPMNGEAWATFARGVRETCPRSCRASPNERSECLRLLMTALSKFDPQKGSSPLPLAKKILRDERSPR